MNNKTKKGHQIDGQILNKNFNHYFAWIANLGVVPLFLLAAFLFAPALFFFAALLFVVTLVLETIVFLLSKGSDNLNFKIEVRFLHFLDLGVKGILIFCPLFAYSSTPEERELLLSKGEVMTIPFKHLKKFSVSNHEVLKYSFDEKKEEMLIKGRTMGFSQILVIKTDGTKEKIDILVANKSSEAHLINLKMNLNRLGLTTYVQGTKLSIKGTLKTFLDYQFYHRLISREKNENILPDIALGEELKESILKNIYQELFQHHLELIHCRFLSSELYCNVYDNLEFPPSFKNFLIDEFAAHFYTTSTQNKKNYLLKLKLVQLEQTDGEEIRMGLESLNTNLEELFRSGVAHAAQKNAFILSQNHLDLKTLAEPQIVTELKTMAEVKVGSELPYKLLETDQKTVKTEWKFAGLKTRFQLDHFENKLRLTFDNELSSVKEQSEGVITGTTQKASLFIKEKTPLKIFDITLKTTGKDVGSFPFLSKIPILGEIFKSKTSTDNYKTITGIVEVSEYDEH